MPDQFTDLNAPSLQVTPPRRPAELPHGLLKPPDKVREKVSQEKANFAADVFSPEAEERLLNEWTLQYYFDYLGHEILYRRTLDGPEVLAVGFDEILAFTRDMPLEQQLALKTWQP